MTCDKLVDPCNVCVHVINPLVLPQTEPLSREETRRRAVYQLLSTEQQYSTCLQFGLSRFLVPLSERRDLLNANEHYTLFQNAEEVESCQCATEHSQRLNWIMLKDSVPCLQVVGREFSVGTATRYRLDGPGIKSQWGWDFPHQSRLAPGHTQPPVHCTVSAGTWR